MTKINNRVQGDLEQYALSLPVVIEGPDDNFYEVSEVDTRTLPEGVVITIRMGDRYHG